MDQAQVNAQIIQSSSWLDSVRHAIGQVLVGQEVLVERLLLCLLCKGHVLLEGVPGLAKTLAIKTLAGTLHASFSRVQFTPDLLPADVSGSLIYNPETRDFTAKLGPIFANLVLADEINRAPAKVQSALLEAMQEKQVTIAEQTYSLPDPFLVLATQNPIDQEGTYQLPEAQLDRFLIKVLVDYPSASQELLILQRMANLAPKLQVDSVAGLENLAHSRSVVDMIYLDPALAKYIVSLVQATRQPEQIDSSLAGLVRAGASPRASINFALAGKAYAYMQQRCYVVPGDIKELAMDILRHRVLLSYEAEAEGVKVEEVIARILERVAVP